MDAAAATCFRTNLGTPDVAIDIEIWPKICFSYGSPRGEVVGVAGLLGSGRTETAQVLFVHWRGRVAELRRHRVRASTRVSLSVRHSLAVSHILFHTLC